jgi:hypothetical protein
MIIPHTIRLDARHLMQGTDLQSGTLHIAGSIAQNALSTGTAAKKAAWATQRLNIVELVISENATVQNKSPIAQPVQIIHAKCLKSSMLS